MRGSRIQHSELSIERKCRNSKGNDTVVTIKEASIHGNHVYQPLQPGGIIVVAHSQN